MLPKCFGCRYDGLIAVCVLLQVLAGNTNTYLVVSQELELPFVASRVRFIPYSLHTRTVCMRVELYGCPWERKSVHQFLFTWRNFERHVARYFCICQCITVVVYVTFRQKHENNLRRSYFVQYILSLNISFLSEDCWSCYVPRAWIMSTFVIPL